jgi:hypothetical protein
LAVAVRLAAQAASIKSNKAFCMVNQSGRSVLRNPRRQNSSISDWVK